MHEQDDVDAFADRDREPVPAEQQRRQPNLRTRAEDKPVRRVAKRYKLRDALADLARLAALPVYPTPFPAINSALGLGGMVCGYAHVVAGGTGKGKTTFLLDLARHHAIHHGPVLFVSLEMPAGHLLARAVSGDVGSTTNALLRGERLLSLEEITLPPRVEIVEVCSLDELRNTVEDVTAEYGQAPLVIVDYLQKLADQVMATMERPDLRLATTAASAELLSIARQLSIPIVLASAISRGSNARLRGANGRTTDPRLVPPDMFDDVAKESGAVEYDAAGLFVLHVSDERDDDGYDIATITIAKSRFGYRCHVAAAYDGAGGRWHDRGRVERKSTEVNAKDATAELAAERTALQLAVLEVLSAGPISRSKLAKALKRRMADLKMAVDPLVRSGQVAETGNGPSSRLSLTEPSLPGMGPHNSGAADTAGDGLHA